MRTTGYAARAAAAALERYDFERRELRPNDVAIEILYCGVCHSDLHQVRNDWGWASFPLVPGHEIIGRVIAVGPQVLRHRVGDAVAVGCMVDSCQDCEQCQQGQEQYCRNGMTQTYADKDRISGAPNQGGYSRHLVVREEFVLRVPAGLDLARSAPLLCAGVTTWSPLRAWEVGPGSRVAIAGLGGLGHMAVKLAVALGAEVTVLSRTPAKQADARGLGAQRLLATADTRAMKQSSRAFDLIIDTIPVKHDVTPYLPLLDIDGTLVLVGHVGALAEPSTVPMIMGRRRVAGSAIGGIPETQELLDFCAARQVLPDVEMIRMEQINEAFTRMERADVRYRFVIDMASLRDA
jgi:uncharacterized zinc-type alcohol dehydrogenase-like protein